MKNMINDELLGNVNGGFCWHDSLYNDEYEEKEGGATGGWGDGGASGSFDTGATGSW